MGFWLYVYLFPPCGQKLQPEGLLEPDIYKKMDDFFLDSVGELKLFEDGFLIEGDKLSVNPDTIFEDIKKFIQNGHNIDFSLGGKKWISIVCCIETFPPRDNWNSHLRFAFPLRQFNRLNMGIKGIHVDVLMDIAHRTNAAYILFGIECGEDFTDFFVEKPDGYRHVVMKSEDGKRYHEINEIWINFNNGGEKPKGVDVYPGFDLGGDFTRYHCVPESDFGWTCPLCGFFYFKYTPPSPIVDDF